MRIGRARWLLVFILILAGLGAFFMLRARGGAEVGPPTALCPGPDGFGYTCSVSSEVSYVDASNDLELYEDDGLVEEVLPFPFSFYGTSYDVVRISSNGTLQFTTERVAFENACLSQEPAAGMGDMIAPYWDDLNLEFSGALETEVVGLAPERIFVVEWDEVPSFADPEDRVTFEVQLHEGSNDITFHYQDVARQQGNRGSSATIGLQSEGQGFALQFGCNQFVLHDRGAIHFVHPLNSTGGLESRIVPDATVTTAEKYPLAKGIAAQLVDTLNRHGPEALPGLRAQWLAGHPRRASQIRHADVDGDGLTEVVVLLRGSVGEPHLTQLAVIKPVGGDTWQLLWEASPLARQEALNELDLHSIADVTGDEAADVILVDKMGGAAVVATRARGDFEMYQLPGKCAGSLVVLDAIPVPEIVRDGCSANGRLSALWNGNAFALK